MQATDHDDDAPRIALLTLYALRHPLLRFDVAPFACGYVLCLALYFGVPSLEVSANMAMPLLVCAHLLVFLVSHWSLSVLCALKLRRVSTVASATLVHVVPATAGAGLATPPSELCELVRRPRYSPEWASGAAASAEETRFEFHKTPFILHAQGEGGGKIFRGLALALHLFGHFERDRDHHQRGGGVGNPHRQQGRGQHETADQGGRSAAELGDNGQRDPCVQVPALD